MKYFTLLPCIALSLLVSCTTQTIGPGRGDDFDQDKAAQTRVSLGLTYLKNGNYSQAKFNLDKALEFAPRSANAHFGLAYYYQSVGEVAAAENAYQQAMDYDPHSADIANSYGAFLCQQGNYAKAKSYFLKAINSSNYISSAETYENLALCSQSQGFQSEASEYLRSAVNHQPGRAKSLFLLTQSLVAEKKWLEAREVLRKYEKVAQVSPESLLMSSQIEQALGNQQAAKAYADMLLKIYPDSSASKTYKQGLVQSAQPAMRKSLKTADELVVSDPQAVSTAGAVVTQVQASEDLAVEPGDESTPAKNEQSNVQPAVKPQVIAPTPITKNDAKQQATTTQAPFHVVQDGENLYRISLRYNIKMQRLIEWNQLSNASDIFAGKKLRLTAPDIATDQE